MRGQLQVLASKYGPLRAPRRPHPLRRPPDARTAQSLAGICSCGPGDVSAEPSTRSHSGKFPALRPAAGALVPAQGRRSGI